MNIRRASALGGGLALALPVLFLSCSDSTGPEVDALLAGPVSFAVVAGDAQSDTIEATLPQPVTVRLQTTGEEARPIQGALINFVVLEEGCGQPFAGSALTDAEGTAAEVWALGTRTGECTMEARAVTSDGTPVVYSTAKATVLPGAPHVVQTPIPATAWVGQPIVLRDWITVEDRLGNTLTGHTAIPMNTRESVNVNVDTLRVVTEVADTFGVIAGTIQTASDFFIANWLTDLSQNSWRLEFSCWDAVTPTGSTPDSLAFTAIVTVSGYYGDVADSGGSHGVTLEIQGTMRKYWDDGREDTDSFNRTDESTQYPGRIVWADGKGTALLQEGERPSWIGGNWCRPGIALGENWWGMTPAKLVGR